MKFLFQHKKSPKIEMVSLHTLLYEEVYLESPAFGKIKIDGMFQKGGKDFSAIQV